MNHVRTIQLYVNHMFKGTQKNGIRYCDKEPCHVECMQFPGHKRSQLSCNLVPRLYRRRSLAEPAWEQGYTWRSDTTKGNECCWQMQLPLLWWHLISSYRNMSVAVVTHLKWQRLSHIYTCESSYREMSVAEHMQVVVNHLKWQRLAWLLLYILVEKQRRAMTTIIIAVGSPE